MRDSELSQDEDLKKTVGMLALALSQIFEWASILENSGSVPKGSLDSARGAVELLTITREAQMIENMLEGISDMESSILLRRMRERLSLLRSMITDIREGNSHL